MFKSHTVSAIINCAGRGTRFGGNKLLVTIQGMTVLETTVRCFCVPLIDEVIVTVSADQESAYREILVTQAQLPVRLVVGGDERHLSAMKGLAATTGTLVVVHDGVRPFVTPRMLDEVVGAGAEFGAAMLGLPSTVQVKRVSDDRFIEGSLDRSHSWLGQTPQVFKRDILQAAYDRAFSDDYSRVSDDADLVAQYTEHRVKIIPGQVNNIKITTPQDLGTARLIAKGIEKAHKKERKEHRESKSAAIAGGAG